MEDFILNGLLLVLVFWLGYRFRGIVLIANLSRDPDHMISVLEEIRKINQEEETDAVTEVKIEHYGQTFYVFSTAQDEFISQGSTLEEALEAAKKRFPSRSFKGLIPADDAKTWGLSDKQ